jgi:2-methylcitrate dehydratase PrpD
MLAPRTLNGLLDIAAIPSESIPASARAMARLSLYDWFTVTRAGENEPVAKIVPGFVADEAGKQAASVAGLDNMVSARAAARAAALANGAASHALDYDDTHFAHVGHPSVAILPAALAVAEEIDAPASAALDALLIGQRPRSSSAWCWAVGTTIAGSIRPRPPAPSGRPSQPQE